MKNNNILILLFSRLVTLLCIFTNMCLLNQNLLASPRTLDRVKSADKTDILKLGLWTSIGPGAGGGAESIIIHPKNPNIVFSMSDTGIIYKSNDGGINWQPANKGIYRRTSPFLDVGLPAGIRFHPKQPDTIFGFFTELGLIFSKDGGKSWIWDKTRSGPYGRKTEKIYDILVDPAYKTKVYYITRDGMFYVSDDGIHVKKLAEGLGKQTGICWDKPRLALDLNSSPKKRTIFVATSKGIAISKDGGKSWNFSNKGLTHNAARTVIAVKKNKKTVLYCTLASFQKPYPKAKGGLFISNDLGKSWQRIGKGLPVARRNGFGKMDINQKNPNIIYIGIGMRMSSNGGIYKSEDAGKTFKKVSHMVGPLRNLDSGYYPEEESSKPPYSKYHVQCLASAPSDPDTVYAYNGWWGINKTSDGGKTWANVSTETLPDGFVRGRGMNNAWSLATAISPFDPNTVFFSLTDEGSFFTQDGGKSLKRFLGYWVYTEYANWYDIKTGKKCRPRSHKELQAVFGKKMKASITDFSFDPKNKDVIYISCGQRQRLKNGMILKYEINKNKMWLIGSSLNGLPKSTFSGIIAISQKNKQEPLLLTAADSFGVFRSEDGGYSWKPSNNGIKTGKGKALRFLQHPVKNNVIFLISGTSVLDHWDRESRFGCLYKSEDYGSSWKKIFPGTGYADVTCITILDDQPSTIFIGIRERNNKGEKFTPSGIYRSKNSGKSWKMVFKTALPTGVSYDKKRKLIFCTATRASDVTTRTKFIDLFGTVNLVKPGIFASSNDGDTWKDIGGKLNNVHPYHLTCAVDNINGKLYVGGNAGVFSANISDIQKKYFAYKDTR